MRQEQVSPRPAAIDISSPVLAGSLSRGTMTMRICTVNVALAGAIALAALTTSAYAHKFSNFDDRFAYISAKLER